MPKHSRFPISRQLDARLQAAVKNAHMVAPGTDQEKMRWTARLGRSAKPVPEKKPVPERKPVRRKQGGGRKPSLTAKQIAHGQKIFRRKLKEDQIRKKQKQTAMLDHLRPLLKFDVSDSTLLRHIVRPVLSK